MFIRITGFTCVLGSSMVMLWTYLLITRSGLDGGGYQIMVYTNMCGEHYLELIWLSVGIFCFVLDFLLSIKGSWIVEKSVSRRILN